MNTSRLGLLPAIVTSAALAQPASTDLGSLTLGTPVTVNPNIGAGQVVWFRFTIAQGTDCLRFLDIDTHGSALAPTNDTEIGLFDSAGALIASDDDDGAGLMSALSFGGMLSPRPPFPGGVAYNGRDGTPGAGTYYLSFSGFNSTFANGWTVVSTSANTGTGAVNISYGAAPALPAGVFAECGTDAGDLPVTALAVSGPAGPLSEIRGSIGANDADMYLIEICDEAAFTATTTGGAAFDTQLFLFAPNGLGVVANDDNPAGGLQSRLTSAFVTANGRYLLAISGYNRDPLDLNAALIWNNSPFNVERVPDGPGQANPIASWTGPPAAGAYSIFLTGACVIPDEQCAADFNTDGTVNSQDFFDFLAAFFAGAPSADFNHDTVINSQDFFDFLTAFFAGC